MECVIRVFMMKHPVRLTSITTLIGRWILDVLITLKYGQSAFVSFQYCIARIIESGLVEVTYRAYLSPNSCCQCIES